MTEQINRRIKKLETSIVLGGIKRTIAVLDTAHNRAKLANSQHCIVWMTLAEAAL